MIQPLHHRMITIPVGAEADARAFYGALLSLREIEQPAALRGRGGLGLEQSPDDRRAAPIRTGFPRVYDRSNGGCARVFRPQYLRRSEHRSPFDSRR